MGQGGNVYQWDESAYTGSNSDPAAIRGIRGWTFATILQPSSFRFYLVTSYGYGLGTGNDVGFRVARILP